MGGASSRPRFNPSKNYISVVQQQGRVTLDPDSGPDFSEILDVDLGLGAARQVPLGKGSGTHHVTITRETDTASPKFLQALVTNEVFKTVKIHFSRGENRSYILKLTDAVIAHIRRVSKPGTKTPCEQVEFSYREMETTIDYSR